MEYAFCPKCGGHLETHLVEERERLVCRVCGFIFYQNSKPCVTVLILRQNNVLLAQRAIEPFKGYWDLPGGFLEAGEAPEAGAHREVLEETGLEIELTELLGLFIGRYGTGGFPTLNICYVANVIGGQARAQSDVEALTWFPLTALPQQIAFDDWSIEALRRLQQRFNE